tara:strand:- start:2376 stop:3155 length:780 start_codon:yes stop_codon:yes gene_type:complete
MSKPVLTCKNIHVKKGKRDILRHLDLDLYSGQVTTLLGSNGAGKSTLLKKIAGQCKKSDQISVFEKPKHLWNTTTLSRHMAVLPQENPLNFPFLAREVVEIGAMPLQVKPTEIAGLADKAMQNLEVLHLADTLYTKLSGGEKQRMQLARVLLQLTQAGDQSLLILDEPIAALDLQYQHHVMRLLQTKAHQQNLAVCVVVHDINLAAQYSDRLIFLHEGKIYRDGLPSQVLTPDVIHKIYGFNATVYTHPQHGYTQIMPA